MYNLKIIIPLIIIFIYAAAGIYYLYQTQVISQNQYAVEQTQRNNFPQATASASPLKTPVGSVQSQSTTKSSASNLPATGSDNFGNLQTIISITNIPNNAQISSPVKVEGFANVTSQTVIINVKDSNGYILGTAKTPACLNLEPCPFSVTVAFSNPQTPNGFIEAYSPSTYDNSQQDKITLSVSF